MEPPMIRDVSAEEFFTTPKRPGEWVRIKSLELRFNPNAFVAYFYLYLAPGAPIKALTEVRKAYRSIPLRENYEIGLVKVLDRLQSKYGPVLPSPDPPKDGLITCPLCGAAIDADPEHWRLAGRRSCAVRAYLTKEEAILELGALGATPESVEASKVADAPFVVNAAMAILRGKRLNW